MVAKMQTVTNYLSQTLHLSLLCVHTLLFYSDNRQSRVRTLQPWAFAIPFLSLAACGDVSLCHSTQARTDRRDFGIFGK